MTHVRRPAHAATTAASTLSERPGRFVARPSTPAMWQRDAREIVLSALLTVTAQAIVSLHKTPVPLPARVLAEYGHTRIGQTHTCAGLQQDSVMLQRHAAVKVPRAHLTLLPPRRRA